MPETIAIGQRWVDGDGREIEIIEAREEWASRGIIARDRLGVLMIDPRVLLRDFRKKGKPPAGAEVVKVLPPMHMREEWLNRPKPKPKKEAPPMTKRQSGYLKRLCKEAGEEFDESWDKEMASSQIARLERITGAGKRRASAA